MAQYKVPQDVEADDKLIGPFSFRQFVYLMITAGLGGLAFLLFRVFPLLAIIPAPFMMFFLILSYPFKKDQPMETYLSAKVAFLLKPHTRVWEPGQGETTIVITAPKKTDEIRTKGLSEEEALHRLSFLADIVDTEGYAIRDGTPNGSFVNNEFYQEASQTQDIFETAQNNATYAQLESNSQAHHNQLVNQMRDAIENNHAFTSANATISKSFNQPNIPTPPSAPLTPSVPPLPTQPIIAAQPNPQSTTNATQANTIPLNPLDAKDGVNSSSIIRPGEPITPTPASTPTPELVPTPEAAPQPSQEIIDLANNSDFSIETIAQQAKRIEEKQHNDEVYISLH